MEMNLHLPQSVEARAETLIMTAVSRHIMTPQFSGPIMGLVQNALIAAYLLTSSVILKKKEATLILMASRISQERIEDWCMRASVVHPHCFDVDVITGVARLNKRVCGRCIMSISFPPGMKWSKKTEADKKRPLIAIENGILTKDSGPLCASSLNKGGTCILAHIVSYYGEERGEQFLTEATRLTDAYIPMHGFSVGYEDTLLKDKKGVEDIIRKVTIECNSIIESTNSGHDRELLLNNVLNGAMNTVSTHVSKNMNLGEDNGFVVMVNSGTKGSIVNLAQISAIVGQQNIQSQRPEKKISGGTRCQQSFEPNDDGPEARGFISHGYRDGITSSEMFFHAGSARIGVLDTSLKTADTGYMGKRMGKKKEDVMVTADGTLRDAMDNIVAFVYGDDGMDARKLRHNARLASLFFADIDVLADMASRNSRSKLRALTEGEIATILSFVFVGRRCDQHLEPTRLATFQLKSMCQLALKHVQVAGDRVSALCMAVILHIESCKVQPGTMVGLIAACSLGEVSMQLTLNTHRAIGRSDLDISMSFAVFTKYINASKNMEKSSCRFSLAGQVVEQLESIKDQDERIAAAMDVANRARGLRLKELVHKTELFHSGKKDCPLAFLPYERYSKPWWNQYYQEAFGKSMRDHKGWVLRLHLDLAKMYEFRMHPTYISSAIEEQCGDLVLITRSPIAKDTIIDLSLNMKVARKKFDHVVDDAYFNYFAIRDVVLRTIGDTLLQGSPRITKVSIDDDGTVVSTEGSDMSSLLCFPFIDPSTVISSDIWDVYNCLGIEAARAELFSNLKKLISSSGSYINDRHYQVVVERLTHTGTLSGANHGGLEECPPLSKILFERPVSILTDSCAFGARDDMKGLASSIMFGKPADIGHRKVEVKNMDTEPVY